MFTNSIPQNIMFLITIITVLLVTAIVTNFLCDYVIEQTILAYNDYPVFTVFSFKLARAVIYHAVIVSVMDVMYIHPNEYVSICIWVVASSWILKYCEIKKKFPLLYIDNFAISVASLLIIYGHEESGKSGIAFILGLFCWNIGYFLGNKFELLKMISCTDLAFQKIKKMIVYYSKRLIYDIKIIGYFIAIKVLTFQRERCEVKLMKTLEKEMRKLPKDCKDYKNYREAWEIIDESKNYKKLKKKVRKQKSREEG